LVRNLHRVKRGAERAEIQEYDADGERTVLVPLDPSISPKENAERHFRLYRRLTRGAKRASERLSTLERMHGDLEAAIERVEKAAPHQLVPLGSRTKRVRPASHTRKAETATKPYREFRAEDETRVWVGRTAAGNDELTFRHARGNEFWLHARNVTGAHVVMKTEAADPPSETLLDAATLAAHFSDARGEPLVEISWTRAKYVHKAKGAPPGSVAMSHEHTLRVRIEATRLERLLATRDTRDAPSRSTP
jgi:predicted ribosome quality control (RQC) complex YloA/Tae2 family protein